MIEEITDKKNKSIVLFYPKWNGNEIIHLKRIPRKISN